MKRAGNKAMLTICFCATLLVAGCGASRLQQAGFSDDVTASPGDLGQDPYDLNAGDQSPVEDLVPNCCDSVETDTRPDKESSSGDALVTDFEGTEIEADIDLQKTDNDKDTIPDSWDNCLGVANPDQKDTDKDNKGDACDEDDDNDGFDDVEDCAPLDKNIFPGATEKCDNIDNDCDGLIDNGPAADCPDTGVCAAGVGTRCDGGNAVCDFTDVPGWCSYDICDGLDNDCDGLVDESHLDMDLCCNCGSDSGTPLWTTQCDPFAADPDDDGDGILDELDNCPFIYNPDQSNTDGDAEGDQCDQDDDGDGDPDTTDCQPHNPLVHHAAAEVCNAIDDNCDNQVDEDLGTITCGLGICSNTVQACVDGQPQPCLPLGPGYPEVCDGLDNDCDGLADNNIAAQICGSGPCQVTVPGCVDASVPVCEPLAAASPEICDGIDNNCNGGIDEGLGSTTCGSGPCTRTVANCLNGVPQTCTPLAPPPGTCNAPPAPCKTTTTGVDACGNTCSKIGPAHCYTVHPACFNSSPGSPTDATACYTPKGKWNCGLTCQEWPNSIGADCTYCVNVHCKTVNGPDEAQFLCANIPIPPTP